MKLTVDRIENEIIVAELPDRGMVSLPLAVCPQAREGDIIDISLCPDERKCREERIKRRMDDLFK